MTEARWLRGTNPQVMLKSLKGEASDRKLRLYALACCRRIWHLLMDERSRKAVEVAERFVDGTAEDWQLTNASLQAFFALRDCGGLTRHPRIAQQWAARAAYEAACSSNELDIVFDIVKDSSSHAARAVPDANRSEQAGLLRDIFGPLPFRSVTIDPAWLSPAVVRLARSIYDDRAFDHLPILADALEDAGCTNQEILSHLRSGGDHVRGCWAVDLLLGRS